MLSSEPFISQPSQFIMIFSSAPAQQRSDPPSHVTLSAQFQLSPSSGFEHTTTPRQHHCLSVHATVPLASMRLSHTPPPPVVASILLPLSAPCFNFMKLTHWNPQPPPATESPPWITHLPALRHYKRDPNSGLSPLPLLSVSIFDPPWVPRASMSTKVTATSILWWPAESRHPLPPRALTVRVSALERQAPRLAMAISGRVSFLIDKINAH
jgi:hypothetical protein